MHAVPSPSTFRLTHPRWEGSHPRWAPLAVLRRFTECPSSKFPSHQQEFMPWVLGCPACTIWPGAKHLIKGLLPGVSQAGTTIQWLTLAFPIKPGEGHPRLRIITPLDSCSVCQAPPARHKPHLLALGLSSSILLGAPHLCCPCLDHFPRTYCSHGNRLGDRKALSPAGLTG